MTTAQQLTAQDPHRLVPVPGGYKILAHAGTPEEFTVYAEDGGALSLEEAEAAMGYLDNFAGVKA